MAFTNLSDVKNLLKTPENMLAVLLCDLLRINLTAGDVEKVKEYFMTSLDAASANILRSEKTKQRMLDALQSEEAHQTLMSYVNENQTFAVEFLTNRFATVVSDNNAETIAGAVLPLFKDKIYSDAQLLENILTNFEESTTLPVVGDSMVMAGEPVDKASSKPAFLSKVPDGSDVGGEHFGFVLKKQAGSAQMSHWQPQQHALPVRGLRNLEPLLSEQPLLYITGFAGVGKSLLISAYLYQQVFNQKLNIGKIFYYRFVEPISTYHQFLSSLSEFLGREIIGSPLGYENELAAIVANSDYIFIVDDVHTVRDAQLKNFLQKCFIRINNNDEFSGKFSVIDRELPEFESQINLAFYRYDGLSVSESSALVRDLWNLAMPKPLARQLVHKTGGNPERMLLFKVWYEAEPHLDSELERFIADIPESDGSYLAELELSYYFAEAMYSSLERLDSRLNLLCHVISIFEIPEQEDFLEQLYNAVGGSDFQEKLEVLVEKLHLVSYDSLTMRYRVSDLLRNFYNDMIDKTMSPRVFHVKAAQLYRERFTQYGNIHDAVLGVTHFYFAEDEAAAIDLFTNIDDVNKLTNHQCEYLLKILSSKPWADYTTEETLPQVSYRMAVLYFRQNYWGEAQELFNQTLEDPADMQTVGNIRYYLAKIARTKGHSDYARELMLEAAKIYSEIGDYHKLADIHKALGDLLLEKGEAASAENHFMLALDYYLKSNALHEKLKLLIKLGALSCEKGQAEQADEYFQRALDIARNLGDRETLAHIKCEIAHIKEKQCLYKEALEMYGKAAEIYRQLNSKRAFAETYLKIAKLHLHLNQADEAFSYLQNAKLIFEAQNFTTGLAACYELLADYYTCQRDYGLAMENYSLAQELYEKNSDDKCVTNIFQKIATVYIHQEEYERALELYHKALATAENNRDDNTVAQIYAGIAALYQKQGNIDYAMDMYRNAASLLPKVSDPQISGEINEKFAVFLGQMGEIEEAEKYFEKACEAYEDTGSAAGLARVYMRMGRCYLMQNDTTKAEKYYQKALQYFNQQKDTYHSAQMHYHLANIYYDTGRLTQARENYQTALNVFSDLGDLELMAQVYGNLSALEYLEANSAKAVALLIEVLLYYQKIGNSEVVEKVLKNLHDYQKRIGQQSFQKMLAEELEKIAASGVKWHTHQVVEQPDAQRFIDALFYS
jgi:tetratricopeptide (TPR) repeat protein